VEESVRMTKDRDKWRKYVHGVANPPIEEAKELGMLNSFFFKHSKYVCNYSNFIRSSKMAAVVGR